MPFVPEDWIDVKKELPDKKFWVLLACMDKFNPFVCIGFLETVDSEGEPHFYTISHGWVDVMYWQELPLHPEIYENY